MSDDTTTSADEPTPPGAITAFTPAELVDYARDVITGKYLMADVRDHDWEMSLALLLSNMKNQPPNASTLFLVPYAAHIGFKWLNGSVPGCTFSAVMVPVESVEALFDQIQTFWRALHPEVPPVPQSGP